MKIVNLIGFTLTVGGVEIPAGSHRAAAPQVSGATPEPVDFEGYGTIPVARVEPVSLADCRLMPGGLSFPTPEEGVVYLAPIPVRLAAAAAGRTDVWGMGDRVSPSDPAAGVKCLVRG